MKKLLLLAAATLFGGTMAAQTNFRHITYEEAIAAAKAEHKLVFMDFYTDWCGPCKMMMRDVFPQKAVGDFMNERFVCIKLNAEKEGKELADLYKVKAYPTFVAIDTDKQVVMNLVGGNSPDGFIAEISRQLDPDKTPERLKERYESGERTADLISAYAGLKMNEARKKKDGKALKDEALKMVQDYFAGLTDAQKLASENLFIYRGYTNTVDEQTARYMVAHRNEFAPADREEINSLIGKLYESQLYGYLTARLPYDAATYAQTKKEVADLGLNADKKYDAFFRLIECHARGDINAYLDLFEKEYASLPEVTRRTIWGAMPQLVKADDKAARRRVSKFIRSLLADMDANDILFTAYTLLELEGKGH